MVTEGHTFEEYTPHEQQLLRINGQIAYLWDKNQGVVRAVQAFLDYMDDETDNKDDFALEAALFKAMRESLAAASAATEHLGTPGFVRLIAAAPRLLEAARKAYFKGKLEYDRMASPVMPPFDECWEEFEALKDAIDQATSPPSK